MMYLKVTEVKKTINSNGLQVSKEALQAMDEKFEAYLRKVIRTTRKGRIHEDEVYLCKL